MSELAYAMLQEARFKRASNAMQTIEDIYAEIERQRILRNTIPGRKLT